MMLLNKGLVLIIKRVLIGFLHIYQWTLSPLLGARCRFYPSCSHYAQLCLHRFSLLQASKLIAIRLAKCHPFHPGGVDLP